MGSFDIPMKLFLIPLHLRINCLCVLIWKNWEKLNADTRDKWDQFWGQKRGNWRQFKALQQGIWQCMMMDWQWLHTPTCSRELCPSTWEWSRGGEHELIAHPAMKTCPSLWKSRENWMKLLYSPHNTKLLTWTNGWKCGHGTDRQIAKILG